MEDVNAVVAAPEAEPPSEAPVQLPVAEAEPQAEEPVAEPSPDEVPAEAEETVEEQPPLIWADTKERLKDNEDYKADQKRDHRQARRQGVASVTEQSDRSIQASGEAWQAVTGLNETLKEMQESGTVSRKDLESALQNSGLNSLSAFTDDQRSGVLNQGITSGLGAIVLALGESKYIDTEAAQQVAVDLTNDAMKGLIPSLRPNAEGKVDITAVIKSLNDYTTDLFDPMAAKIRAPLEKENATLRAEIDAFKAGRTESPSSAAMVGGGGARPTPTQYSAATPETRAQWKAEGIEPLTG